MSAVFSPDGRYRYVLRRQVGRCSALGGGDFDPDTGKPRPLRCALDHGHAGAHHALGEWVPGVEGYDRRRGPVFVVVGLNPSTADATQDDPTIRRCVAFARREGCLHLAMLNLFALRSTDPDGLLESVPDGVGRRLRIDAVGPDNDAACAEVFDEVARHGGRVVAAWGNTFAKLTVARVEAVSGALQRRHTEVSCFGVTKDGAPRHPLYLRADAPLVRWP